MVPTTLVGVLVFVASVGPGYVYVKVVERWRPYVERTPLRETAEIVVTGSLATVIGVIFALAVGQQSHLLDVNALSAHGGLYLLRHPWRTVGGVGLVLGVSYGLAWGVALAAPGKGAKVFPDSAWYSMFERRLPGGKATLATVELRDGRYVSGLVYAFTAEPSPVDERELTLTKSADDKMKVLLPGATEPHEIPDEFLILQGADIASIACQHVAAIVVPVTHDWRDPLSLPDPTPSS